MLIILDRDGVINFDSPEYIKSPDEWHAIPGSLAAIVQLNEAGHKVVVATNQSGVGRKYYSLQTLSEIHAKMIVELAKLGGHIDGLKYCPHHPDDGCACRKPQPGMILELLDELAIKPADTIIIGDSFRDFEAAQAAHCQFLLVKTGNGQQTLANNAARLGDINVFDDLAAAANFVTNEHQS